VYQDAGRWDETLHNFQKSAELSDRIGEERRRAAANINLGEVYYLRGELDRAIAANEQALHLARALGFNDHVGIASLNLGKAFLRKDDLVKAERHLDESLETCRHFHMDVYMPEILRYHSELSAKKGQLTITLNDAQEAMALAEKMGPREVGLAHRSLGIAYRELGQLDLANVHLTQSLSILEQQHIPYEVGLTLVELARLRKAQSETGPERKTLRVQGIAYCEQAIRIFDQLGADWDLRMAREVRRALEE
jgi:tetratricopeptide (TPR) repeat protein